MTLLEFCKNFDPGEELFLEQDGTVTVNTCRLLELEEAGKEAGQLSCEYLLPSDVLMMVQPGNWRAYNPRRAEDRQCCCWDGTRSICLTREALHTLEQFRLVIDPAAAGMSFDTRRPYFRMRGRPVTKAQAFDILSQTGIPIRHNYGMDRYPWEDLAGGSCFLDNNWYGWPRRGWVRPDGTIGMNGISGVKYPWEREITAEIIPLGLAFPFLDLMIAVTDWNEAPGYAWDVYFGKVGDEYTYDGDDEVFQREDYPDSPEHIVYGVWLHDSTVELMAPERAREKYIEYDRLYGGPDEEIFKEFYNENRDFFPADLPYLKRLIRAHGLDPEEVLAGYKWGRFGWERRRSPEVERGAATFSE